MTIDEILALYEVDRKLPKEDHHVTDGWIGTECPWCGEGSGNFHMGFNENGKAATCWRCGKHSVVQTLSKVTGESIGKLLEMLEFSGNVEREVERPHGKLTLPKGIGPMTTLHRSYLENRGFDPSELERTWKLQGIGLAKHLAWRIFIPIRHKSKTVSWTTRSVSNDTKLRYVTAKPEEEELPAKSILFGMDFIKHSMIVVEGPLDAMRIGPGSAATLGLSYTREQFQLMTKVPRRAICFDSEPVAKRRAVELCDRLRAFPGTNHLIEIDAEDPGSASEREVALLRKVFLE